MTDPTLTYHGHVEGDEIKLPRAMRKEMLAVFQGKEIEVTVKRKRRRRSNEQNRYYWGCIVRDIVLALREDDPETGWNAEGVHEVLKLKFLPVVREWREYVNEDTGEAIREPMTTTKLTKFEQEQYHDHCRKWAAEFLNITIALPNEQAEMSFAV